MSGDRVVRAAGFIASAGVGKDHGAYLAAEKGQRGMRTPAAMIEHFDPDGAGNLPAERAF